MRLDVWQIVLSLFAFTMNRLRLGVIGTGRMGKSHCRIYSNLRHGELVGVYDQSLPAAQSVAKTNLAECYANLDALLDQVDAVSITTPTPTHFELAMRCIERGVHVLIEKPVTHSLEQARQLVAAAEASDLIVQVGHIERFNPAYRELKNLVDGATVMSVDFRRLSPYRGSNMDVDVVLDLMIHDIDLALNLAGEMPQQIWASGISAYGEATRPVAGQAGATTLENGVVNETPNGRTPVGTTSMMANQHGVIDYAVAQLRFASGLMLMLTASRLTEQKVRIAEVTALEAFITADLLNKSVLVYRSTIGENVEQGLRGVKYRQENIVERIQVPIFEPLYLELQDFVDCVLEGRKPQVTAQDGMNALALAEDIRSAILPGLIRRGL